MRAAKVNGAAGGKEAIKKAHEFIANLRAPFVQKLEDAKAACQAKFNELSELNSEKEEAEAELKAFDQGMSEKGFAVPPMPATTKGKPGRKPGRKPGPKPKAATAAAQAPKKRGRKPAAETTGVKRPRILEAIVKVMGKETLGIGEIMDALTKAKWLPPSTNPRGYVSGVLSANCASDDHPERIPVFEPVEGKGRGHYRVIGSVPEPKRAAKGEAKAKETATAKPSKAKTTTSKATSSSDVPSAKDAIAKVLEDNGGTMSNKDIVKELESRGWLPSSGAGYVSTVLSNVKFKDTFEQVSRGQYRLKAGKGPKAKAKAAAPAEDKTASADDILDAGREQEDEAMEKARSMFPDLAENQAQA